MTTNPSLKREGNSFGFLRVLFASLVILSHAPETIDGNRSREILTRMFHTVSFGDFAVDGFFLISGYLVTASYLRSETTFEYLMKRFLRIYPGFWVACAFSYAVGWLTGGRFIGGAVRAIERIANLVLCNAPSLVGAYPGLHYHNINGAVWTIAYELRCYLLVVLLGSLGVLRRKYVYLVVTLLLVAINISQVNILYPGHISLIVGDFDQDFRLYSLFMCGGLFLLFRKEISYSGRWSVIAAFVLIPLMFSSMLVTAALGLLGGYLLFGFAFHFRSGFLSRVGTKTDLSYGIYLYASPIGALILFYFRGISPWLLAPMCFFFAVMCAYLSWTFIEKPFLALKRHLPTRLYLPIPAFMRGSAR